ncbi:MAG: hypothetical protein ACFNX0_00115 [Treponema sp.]
MDLENEMDETKEKRTIEVPILKQFITHLNQVVHTKELALQTEKRRKRIAKLHGYIAGVRKYQILMDAAGLADLDTQKRARPFFTVDEKDNNRCLLNPQEITEANIAAQAFISMPEYQAFKKMRERAIEQVKTHLFFYFNKGSDLYWCKEWYKAMIQIDNWIEQLQIQVQWIEAEMKHFHFLK